MAMGRSEGRRQDALFITDEALPKGPAHPFYQALNGLLESQQFDLRLEQLCAASYAPKMGRPSLPPGVYFRLLLIGFFEGLESERAIAWRVADSLALRAFLGLSLTQRTPDHSTISGTRRRLSAETHQAVFQQVLALVAEHGLLRGQTVGVDATTLEANAALKSIVRRDTGESYQEFLRQLAVASGIDTPTHADLAKLDRERPRKGSNDDWQNPHNPDACIAKMKNGSTHFAEKAEHAVDLDTGAILAVTVQGAAVGDSTSLVTTLLTTVANLKAVKAAPAAAAALAPSPLLAEVVADKGYHSNQTCTVLAGADRQSCISEPRRHGQRRWAGKADAQRAVEANHQRVRSDEGKALLRRRGELLERPFRHYLGYGGMRRVHLIGHPNILKRLLLHVSGFNLGLVLRQFLGVGKPRAWANSPAAVKALLTAALGDMKTAKTAFFASFSGPPAVRSAVWAMVTRATAFGSWRAALPTALAA